MVTISKSDVADALHLDDASELPSGAELDIDSAETIVADQVEPYAGNDEAVEKCAIFVACAFITGTEDDHPVSSMQRETASVSFDTDVAAESSDYWARAQAIDPTDRLGRPTISFESIEGG